MKISSFINSYNKALGFCIILFLSINSSVSQVKDYYSLYEKDSLLSVFTCFNDTYDYESLNFKLVRQDSIPALTKLTARFNNDQSIYEIDDIHKFRGVDFGNALEKIEIDTTQNNWVSFNLSIIKQKKDTINQTLTVCYNSSGNAFGSLSDSLSDSLDDIIGESSGNYGLGITGSGRGGGGTGESIGLGSIGTIGKGGGTGSGYGKGSGGYGSSGKTKTEKKYVSVPVFFATDRNDTKNEDLNKRFGGKRAELSYGYANITIPKSHEMGKIERPTLWRLELTEDPKKHIILQGILPLDREGFIKLLNIDIGKTNEKSTFLFVHGYNVSFASAAMRTAQMAYDLKFKGSPVFYSWPSQGSTAGYTVDENNIEWSKTNMKIFLEDYLSKTVAEDVYLIAHSMGNRGLTKAIIELMNEHPELNDRITEIILAAPDIDADIFKRDIAPKMVQKVDKPITLYVSSDDIALKASLKVHGNPRAGDAKNIVVIPGVETIDATGVDTSFLSHSYFAETNSIIQDILDIIETGKRAAQRQKLTLEKIENQYYWKVQLD